MVLENDRWLESYVAMLSKKYSYQQVVRLCKSCGYGILQKEIIHILNYKSKQHLAKYLNGSKPTKYHLDIVLTPAMIRHRESIHSNSQAIEIGNIFRHCMQNYS